MNQKSKANHSKNKSFYIFNKRVANIKKENPSTKLQKTCKIHKSHVILRMFKTVAFIFSKWVTLEQKINLAMETRGYITNVITYKGE